MMPPFSLLYPDCGFDARVGIGSIFEADAYAVMNKGGITMAEQQLALPHKLTLNQRSSLTMTGVTEVVSFDENAVIVRTELGALTVQGQQLQLKTLSVEGGQIAVEGHISLLAYEEPRQKGGWVHRLFG